MTKPDWIPSLDLMRLQVHQWLHWLDGRATPEEHEKVLADLRVQHCALRLADAALRMTQNTTVPPVGEPLVVYLPPHDFDFERIRADLVEAMLRAGMSENQRLAEVTP